MPPEGNARPAAVRRAILLGASNLALGLQLVACRLLGVGGGPWEILASLGRGRSYVDWSRYLFVRGLPGIERCALWQELDRRPPLPAVALVTDVGSDLLYGHPVERIAAAVESCLDRLVARRAEVVLARLPLARLATLSPLAYGAARRLLYPGRAVDFRAVLDGADQLDAALVRLGEARSVRLVAPPAAWYGVDPIHLRRRARREAWEELLRFPSLPPATATPRVRLPLVSPAEWRLFGRARRAAQPAARFADGSTLALY
ncbi:MAG TPA: hypothetical protein VGE98_10860 [Thermoanaerobaculia bacterium]